MLNLENLNQLADGDETLREKLLTAFFQTTSEDILNLKAAVHNHQSSLVASFAHRIKGGAAILGAEQLVSLANEMEHAGHQDNHSQYEKRFDELQAHFKKIEHLFPGF